jgi:hypothetical protein
VALLRDRQKIADVTQFQGHLQKLLRIQI